SFGSGTGRAGSQRHPCQPELAGGFARYAPAPGAKWPDSARAGGQRQATADQAGTGSAREAASASAGQSKPGLALQPAPDSQYPRFAAASVSLEPGFSPGL